MLKKLFKLIITAAIIFGCIWLWKEIRENAAAECTPWTGGSATAYTDEEKALKAVSFSTLAYGCESIADPEGTVSALISSKNMGIINENAEIARTDESDPSTARINSADYIKLTAGESRFITELKNEKNGFYGAAFADDAAKVVWIAYSGAVSFTDVFQAAGMIAAPALTGQEECAFELYEKVIQKPEIETYGYSLILTGHSLGGGLAAMVAHLSGCEAVTVNGLDGAALTKLKAIENADPSGGRIVNMLAKPGRARFTIKDIVQRFLLADKSGDIERHVFEENGMTENSHCAFAIIEFASGNPAKPKLPDSEVSTDKKLPHINKDTIEKVDDAISALSEEG